jgi:hypothetical protein
MKMRQRKFIGTLLTVGMIIVYSLIAMVIGARYLTDAGTVPQLLGFIVLGCGWIPPFMVLVRWMSRPDPAP